ncbi:MAG: class I SAM-dependent methyltransferase [Defluviitaleaceae bacterium]|nr:class I SAM-dependent methyltransferase [Defluviitaleaceae bacterium]
MDFDQLKLIKNENERISALYTMFNEDSRLSKSKAARVEFITTMRYIEKYLKKDSKIIDIGAGAGEYSLHLAKMGYSVSAVELADTNVAAFRNKLTPDLNVDLHQGDACDLSSFTDNSFDIVLLLGPLYHILDQENREKCIAEARRVCSVSGVIFFAYISNDMVILTETFKYDGDYLKMGNYNKQTFAVNNFPFVFTTASAAREELVANGILIKHEVAVDGVSELLADKINKLDDEGYQNYLDYHFYCCEKPEMLGRSNHMLFVGCHNPTC